MKKKSKLSKHFEFQEKIAIDYFLIKFTQFEKNGSMSILLSRGNLKIQVHFRNEVFSRLFLFRIWTAQFGCPVADELQLNSKST